LAMRTKSSVRLARVTTVFSAALCACTISKASGPRRSWRVDVHATASWRLARALCARNRASDEAKQEHCLQPRRACFGLPAPRRKLRGQRKVRPEFNKRFRTDRQSR
jgi:hypothetical protein